METKKDKVIQLKGTNEAYLLHYPQTATEFQMPLYDKIIAQLLEEIEARDKLMIENSQIYSKNIDRASGNITDMQAKVMRLNAKISRLESMLEAADSLIEVQAKSLGTYGSHILIENQYEKYNQLKAKK